jgi:hypothetical protein
MGAQDSTSLAVAELGTGPTEFHQQYLSGQELDWRRKRAMKTVHGVRFRLLP